MAALKGREQFEADFAQRTAKLSARHRRELQQWLGRPPNPANVPADFWRRVEDEMREEWSALLLLIFIASATQHGSTPDQATARGQQWADSQSRNLASGWTQNSQAALETASQRWQQAEAAGQPVTQADVRDATTTIFGPTRIEGMSISETTAAASAGGEQSIGEAFGFTAQDTWYTQGDGKVCPVCSPLHGVSRQAWSRKFPSGPPAHPRCRCYIEYANEKSFQLQGGT